NHCRADPGSRGQGVRAVAAGSSLASKVLDLLTNSVPMPTIALALGAVLPGTQGSGSYVQNQVWPDRRWRDGEHIPLSFPGRVSGSGTGGPVRSGRREARGAGGKAGHPTP